MRRNTAMSNTTVEFNFETLKNFLIIGIPLGLLTTNILFINQFPDYNSDKKSNKINLVVIFGKKLSKWIYLINLLIIFSLTFYFFTTYSQNLASFNYYSFYIVFSLLILYGLYNFWGLFKFYNSRNLILYNIHTIYYQIAFCFGIILILFL